MQNVATLHVKVFFMIYEKSGHMYSRRYFIYISEENCCLRLQDGGALIVSKEQQIPEIGT